MFTVDNTEGFTQAECDLMNEAVTMRIRIYGEDERTASERVSNLWIDGADLRRLIFEAPYEPKFRPVQFAVMCDTEGCSNRGELVCAVYDLDPERSLEWVPQDCDQCTVCGEFGVLAEGLEEVDA